VEPIPLPTTAPAIVVGDHHHRGDDHQRQCSDHQRRLDRRGGYRPRPGRCHSARVKEADSKDDALLEIIRLELQMRPSQASALPPSSGSPPER
jgi:hypothetical protein